MHERFLCSKGFVSLLLLLIPIIGCTLPSGHPVSVTISEIGACTDYDRTSKEPIGITEEFSPTADQICVFFYAKTNLETEITYRWLFEEDLIAEYRAPLDEGYNFGWITPRDTFPEGDYRVEILLDQSTLQSTSFRVVFP